MSALVPRSRGEDGGPSAASSSAAQVGDGKPYSPASLSRVHSYPQSAPQQKGHGTQATTILGRSSSTQVSRTPTSVLYSSYGSVRTPISSMNDLISAEINPCSASLLLLGRTVALPSLQGDASFNRTRRRVLVGEAGGDERGRSGESPHDVCTLDVSSTTGGGSSAASTRSSSSISSSASSVGFSSQPPRMSASSTTQESLHRSSATFVPAECSSSMTLRRDKYEERPYVTSPSMPSSTHTTSTTSSFSSAKGRSTPFSSLLSSSVTDISRTSALPDFLSLLSLSHPLDFPGKYHLTSQYFVLDSIIQSTAGLNTPVKLPLDTSSSICFEPSIRCALHPPSSSLRFNSASSTSLASQPLCCTRDLPAGSTAQQYTPQTVKDTSLSSSPPGSSGKPSQTMLAGSALKRVLGPHLLLPPAVVAVPLHAPIVLVDRLPVATPSTPSLFFPPSFVSPSTNSSPSLSSNDDGLYTPRPSPYVPSSYPSRPAPPPPPPREGCTFHPQSSEYPFRQASASEFSSQSSSYHSSPSSHGSGHRHTGGGFMHRSLRIDFSPSPTEATEALAGSTAMEGDTTQEVSESYGDRKSTVSASCDNDKRLLSEPPYKSSSSLTSDQSALHSSEEEEAGKEEDDEEEWAEDAPEEDALLTRVEEESLQSPFTGGSIPSPFTIAFVSALKSALRLWAERLTLIEQQQASGNSRLSPIPASCLASTTKEESTKAGEESLTKDHSDRNIFVSSSVHRDVGPSDGNSKETDEGRRNQEVLSSSSFSRSSPPLDPRGVHVCLVIPHIFLTYQSGKLTSISSMLEKGYERRCCNRLRRQLHQYRQNLQQQQQVSSSNLYRDGVSSSSSSSAISSMTFEQNQYQNPANVYKNVLSRDRCMSTSSSSLSGVSNPEGDQSYQPIQGGRGARLLINAFSKSQKDNLSRDERKGNSEVEASTSSSTSPSVNDRVCKQIEEDVAWLPLAYHHQSRVAEMKRKSTSEENMHQEEEGVSLKKDDGLKKHAFKFVSSNHKKTAEAVEGDDGNIYRMVADCQWAGHGLFNLQDDRTLGTDEEKQNPLLQKETELLLDQKYVHGIILASFLEVYIHPKRRLSSVITPPWASSPYPNHSALSAHPMNEGLASKRVTHSSSSMPLHTGGGISSPWIADDSFDVSVVSGSFSLDELRGIQRRFRQNSSGVSVSEFVRLAIEITRTQFSRLGLLIVARPMEALFLSNRLRTTHFSTLFSEALVLYTTGHASLSLPLFHVAFRSAVEVLKNNRKATSHRDFQVAGTMRRGRFSSSSSLGKTEEETRPALARWKNFNSKKSEGNHDEEESHLGKNHVEDHLLTKTIVRSGDSSTGQYGGGGSDAEKTGNFGEEGENERTREKKESALSLLHLVIAWRGAFNLWTREQKKAVIETQEHGEKQTARDFLSEGWLDETKSGREKNQESVSGRAIKKTVESCVRLCCDVLEVVDILLEALLAPSCSSTTAALNDEVLSMMACRKRETGGWEGLEVFAVVECLRAEAFDFLSELLWMFPSINFIGKDCRAALMQHLSSFSPPAPSTRSSSSSPSQRRNAGSRCRPAIQFPTTRQPPISYCTFGKIPSVEVTSSSFSSSSSSTASSSSSTKASLITTIQNDRSVSSPSSFDETVLWSERKTRMSPSSSSSPSHSSPLWLHIAACAFGFKEQDRIPKGSVEELSWKHLVIGASGAFERAYQVAIKLNIKSEIRWDIILSFSSFLLYSAQQVNLAVVILKAHLDVYDSQFSSPSSFPCSSSTSPLTCLTRSSDELTSFKSHGTKKETSSSLSDLSQQEGSSTQHKTDINNDPTSSSLVNSPSLSCSLLVDQARRLYAACSVHVVVLVFDIDTSVLLKPLAGSSCLSIGRMTASSRDMATGNLFLCSSPPQRYYALKSSTGQDTSLSFSSSYMYHRSRGAKGDSSPGIQVERRQKMYQILQQEGSRGEVDSPNDDNNDYSKEEEKSAGLLGRKKYEGRDEGAGNDMVEKFFLCSSTTREKGSKTSMSLSSYSSHRGGGGESAGAPNTFNPFLIPFAR
ncbi:hypothetical protein CSUI_007371 [Cystoisospora suis]|uniref:Uncharacterized protein n=1 Tax=Cystoisospora suis TaxID=483139 RepID=A0A2C6KQU9_9APIC|nr:hypothetical protein CSUI_007371 [Cystoisospora suis]